MQHQPFLAYPKNPCIRQAYTAPGIIEAYTAPVIIDAASAEATPTTVQPATMALLELLCSAFLSPETETNNNCT